MHTLHLVRSYGEDIQLDRASHLQHIARMGLPKEVRKELMDKYLPPENCTLIEAPILNPEVVAAVSEAVLKRDKATKVFKLAWSSPEPQAEGDSENETACRQGSHRQTIEAAIASFEISQQQSTDPDAFTIDAFTISWSNFYFYSFPPFTVILKALRKIINDRAKGIMVQSRDVSEDYPGCRNLIRTALLKRNVPQSSIHIMLASLSHNSIKQYDTCLRKWFIFCKKNHINLHLKSASNVITFLTQLYEAGAGYGTLNSCRSALSLFLGQEIADDDLIKRFLKGTFRLRPPLPKYNITWDTSMVLNSLADWYPNDALSLEKLSKKLATLLALTTAHRLQTISKINIKNIEIYSNEIHIKIPDLIKSSRPGSTQPLLILPIFL
ncbi:unnamed protein product [Euphydryas editha]|uniref:Uncharacterized protein n=1 Tax=Euphydryas editha TaxID=104508 RepID=A0AAU9VBT7_EUPED|nr:unnamed protein product [Euphydryas editha]